MVEVADTPEISVVIPHYGDPALANQLIDDLMVTRGGDGLELIVVDDASPVPFPERAAVRTIRRPVNGGFGAAVNSGADVARGKHLVILNSDLRVGETALADWLSAASSLQPALTGPSCHDGQTHGEGRRFPTVLGISVLWLRPAGRLLHQPWFMRLVGHDPRSRSGEITAVDWVSGAAMAVPREVFQALGGFDPRFRMFSEEVDLQRRCQVAGVPRYFIGTVQLSHVGGASTDPAQATEWLMQGLHRYFGKWGGRRRLQVGLTLATIINFAWNMGARLRGTKVNPAVALRRELMLIWRTC